MNSLYVIIPLIIKQIGSHMTTLNISLPDTLYDFLQLHIGSKKHAVEKFVMEAIETKLESEKVPNAITLQTFAESDKGMNLRSFSSLSELYKDLGINA